MLYGDESKRQLDKHVEQLIIKSEQANNKKKRRVLYDELKKKFNMTVNVAEEILTFKKDMAYFTPFELFCVVWFLDRNSLGKFFIETSRTDVLIKTPHAATWGEQTKAATTNNREINQ